MNSKISGSVRNCARSDQGIKLKQAADQNQGQLGKCNWGIKIFGWGRNILGGNIFSRRVTWIFFSVNEVVKSLKRREIFLRRYFVTNSFCSEKD